MADQDLAGLPFVQRWHATGDYAYPAEEREDGEFVEYEAYCALARENAELRDIISKLQAIIQRWLPDVRAGNDPLNDQIGDDAYGLMGYEGDDRPKYGDQIFARMERVEAELAALKRRIAEAPTATVTNNGDTYCHLYADPGMDLADLDEQRVALLPVGGEG